jgi:hypothetical protein
VEEESKNIIYSLTYKVIAIRSNRGYQPRVEKDAHRINNLIRGVQEVRLVGENIEPGVLNFQKLTFSGSI